MNHTEIEKILLLKNEYDFHSILWDYIIKHGTWQELFPAIVQYNTSYYFIKQLQTEIINKIYKKYYRISLCVSEDNWMGKIENLKSTVYFENNRFILKANKSFAFKADIYIIISQYQFNDSKEIAIVFLKHNKKINFHLRNEEYLTFYDANKNIIMNHYKIQFEGIVHKKQILLLPKSRYKEISYVIPLREVTTFGLVLLALYYYKKNNVLNETYINDIYQLKETLLQIRKHGLSYKDAKNIIQKIKPYIDDLNQNEPHLNYIMKLFNPLIK